MKKVFFLLMFFVITTEAIAQVAIIKAKEGFTNVRKEANATSEVKYKILENEVFWFDYEEGIDKEEWIPVFIPKNQFSLESSQQQFIKGFIHKSQLQPLDKLSPYKGKDFKFEYNIEPFSLENRIADLVDGRVVTAISGRPVWGTDGDFPDNQVKGMKVSIEGKPIKIHSVFFSDIYQVKNEFMTYKNNDTYFVHQWNSDGAGYYEIVWVFSKNELKQRLVGSMY